MRLQFAHIQFWGIESLEPPFNPDIREYTIRRKAGSDFSFQAVLDKPPAPPERDGGWSAPQYRGYSLEIFQSFSDTKDFWAVGQVKGLSCPVGESYVEICCVKSKRNLDDDAQTIYLKFNIITESMSEEAVKVCPHRRTHTSEGECWGGASGSCSVEMISSCDDCGATIERWFDYRN